MIEFPKFIKTPWWACTGCKNATKGRYENGDKDKPTECVGCEVIIAEPANYTITPKEGD